MSSSTLARARPRSRREPLPQGLGDDAGHRLAGGARDLLREAMSLRIFDVQAHFKGFLPL